jgi:hypothetical protein
LTDLLTHELILEGPLVAGESRLDLRPLANEDLVQQIGYLAEVYAAVIEIEARAGVWIQIPDPVGAENATAALNLAHLMRDAHATGSSRLQTTLHVMAQQAPALAARLATTRSVTVPFSQDLMGRTVHYKWARITFERLSATLGPPDASGQASVRVEADGEIDVRLIEEPLPSDVAMDLVTGNWQSAMLNA